jgi:CRISPR-associated protein Cmr1
MQTLVARYRVTTPVFMGAPESPEKVELNLRGVKGAVRFWWRALNYARLLRDGKDIREEEGRLFGAAAEKGRDYGGSRFKWRVGWEGGEEPPKQTTRLPGAQGKQGVAYLANQGLAHAGNNAGRLKRPCYWGSNKPMVLVVELIAPDKWVDDNAGDWSALQDALRLFGLLGGIGSRTSRGFGSISLDALETGDSKTDGPADLEQYCAALTSLLSAYTVQSTAELPGFPAFSAKSRIWVIATADSVDVDAATHPSQAVDVDNDPLSLLDYIGRQIIRYRSFGRNDHGTHKTILHEIAEQNFRDDHDWAKCPLAPPHDKRHAERIAFGMPQGYTGCDVSFVKPYGYERRGSPLLFHIHRLISGEHIGIATMLPAKLTPGGKVGIVMPGHPADRPLSRDVMNGFEEKRAWEVLAGFVEGKSKTTGKPYFNRRQLIWAGAP